MKTLLILLLMTGMAWADDHITLSSTSNYSFSNLTEKELYTETSTYLEVSPWVLRDGKPIKISCPDGYELTTKITNRNYDKECQNGRPDVICYHNMKFTDAELRCVKDSQ